MAPSRLARWASYGLTAVVFLAFFPATPVFAADPELTIQGPPGADVNMDGMFLDQIGAQGELPLGLPPGTYKFEVTSGLQKKVRTVYWGAKEDEKLPFSFVKEAPPPPVGASVDIIQAPRGAVVSLDGRIWGQTNGDGLLSLDNVAPGAHFLTVVHKTSNLHFEQQIHVRPSMNTVVSAKLQGGGDGASSSGTFPELENDRNRLWQVMAVAATAGLFVLLVAVVISRRGRFERFAGGNTGKDAIESNTGSDSIASKLGSDIISAKFQYKRYDDLIGRRIGGESGERFEFLEKIGVGGMGAVFRARDHHMGREVALKVITPRFSDNPRQVKRFLREVKISSRLSDNPNIVTTYDFDKTKDGVLFLAMELLKGKPLSLLLKPRQPLPISFVKTIFMQISSGLEALHTYRDDEVSAGIVHRDLKPANVFVIRTPSGEPLAKLLDFGIAKIAQDEGGVETEESDETDADLVTKFNEILGSPPYMPPEQWQSTKDVDHRGDIYALGVILHQMITGRLPFSVTDPKQPMQWAAAHTTEAPASIVKRKHHCNDPELAKRLDVCIQRALMKRAENRYQNVSEFRKAVIAVFNG